MPESKEYWEKQKENALKEMKKIWPRIQEARTKLNLLTTTHGKYQALVYEAERHLVEVIKLKPADSAKVKNTHWMKKIQTLSQREKDHLVRMLEGKQANGSL